MSGSKKEGFHHGDCGCFEEEEGKREYLNDAETRRMMKKLNEYFESKVDLPLIRHSKKRRIETLINEEALMPAKYLRGEMKDWVPRLAL